MDYITGPAGLNAPRTTIKTPLPQHLENLKLNAETLAAKAAAHAGTPDQAARLQSLLAEVADLSASWPDPTGRLSPHTDIHLSDDPKAWRDDDPSFDRQVRVDGILNPGRQSVTVAGKALTINVKSVRRFPGSAVAEAYASVLAA